MLPEIIIECLPWFTAFSPVFLMRLSAPYNNKRRDVFNWNSKMVFVMWINYLKAWLTPLMCKILCPLIHSWCCTTITTTQSQNSLSSSKEVSCTLSNHSPLSFPGFCPPLIVSISVDLFILYISCKYVINYLTCVTNFHHLAYFQKFGSLYSMYLLHSFQWFHKTLFYQYTTFTWSTYQ